MKKQSVKSSPAVSAPKKRGRLPAAAKTAVTFPDPTYSSDVYPVPSTEPAPSKYHRVLNGFWIDIYDVLDVYEVTNPGDQHAIKKMVMPGGRGVKTGNQDREEAIVSLKRAIQLTTRSV